MFIPFKVEQLTIVKSRGSLARKLPVELVHFESPNVLADAPYSQMKEVLTYPVSGHVERYGACASPVTGH
jgi:hypothetical protein